MCGVRFVVSLKPSRTSFENVRKVCSLVIKCYSQWYKELTSNWTDETRDVPIILVATKKDLLTDEEVLKKVAVDSKYVVSLDEVRTARTLDGRWSKWRRKYTLRMLFSVVRRRWRMLRQFLI